MVTKMNFMDLESLRKSNYFSRLGILCSFLLHLANAFIYLFVFFFFIMCLIANALKSHFVQMVQMSNLFISVIMVM